MGKNYYIKKEYLGNDFIDSGKPIVYTVEDYAEKKINLLYDFCILERGKKHTADPREELVRGMLINSGSEESMTRLLRPVLRDELTLNQLLRAKDSWR